MKSRTSRANTRFSRCRVGPTIQFEPTEVTEKHREQWREKANRPRLLTVGTPAGGSRQEVMSLPIPIGEPDWPEHLPAFLLGAVTLAPDGRLWVRRTTGADEPPTYDVIDSTGRVQEQVRFPGRDRIVGFGDDGSIYVIRRDEFDLEYLERHRLPRP